MWSLEGSAGWKKRNCERFRNEFSIVISDHKIEPELPPNNQPRGGLLGMCGFLSRYTYVHFCLKFSMRHIRTQLFCCSTHFLAFRSKVSLVRYQAKKGGGWINAKPPIPFLLLLLLFHSSKCALVVYEHNKKCLSKVFVLHSPPVEQMFRVAVRECKNR